MILQIQKWPNDMDRHSSKQKKIICRTNKSESKEKKNMEITHNLNFYQSKVNSDKSHEFNIAL